MNRTGMLAVVTLMLASSPSFGQTARWAAWVVAWVAWVAAWVAKAWRPR